MKMGCDGQKDDRISEEIVRVIEDFYRRRDFDEII